MSLLGMFSFLFVITAVAYSDAFCPKGCKCFKKYSSFRVHCQSSLLSVILQNIPINATDLYLTIGNIKRITVHDFKRFTKLRSLSISAKNLTAIDDYAFSHLKKLTKLKISGTKLVAVKNEMLSGLIALETFIIERSKTLKTVHQDLFQEVKHHLRRVYILHCDIELIHRSTFAGLHKLKSLYLQNNQLSSLQAGTFSTLSMLEVLILNYNNIQYLKSEIFHGLISLRTLSLKNNKIKAINPDSFSPLSNLLTLDLRNNKIESLSNYTFFNLTKLRTLYLENNVISEIKENTFIGLLDLETLNLNNNKLKDINHLLSINISLTKCLLPTWKMDYLSRIENLKILQICENNISSIDKNTFSGLSKLQELHLQNNQISSIDSNSFRDLNQLKILHLESNKLAHISKELFYHLENLKNLYLSDNYFRYLEEGIFAMNFQLKNLHLKNNRLTHFNTSLFSPRIMSISSADYNKTDFQESANRSSKGQNSQGAYMRIEDIKKGHSSKGYIQTFSQRMNAKSLFSSFRTIDLNENQLEYIPDLEWSRFPNFYNIFLRYNSISTLEPSLLQEIQNTRIDVRYNRYKCSCYFQDILKSIQHIFIRMTCVLRDEIKDIFDLDCEKLRTGWKEIRNFSKVFRNQKDLRKNSSSFGLLPTQFQVDIEIFEIQIDSGVCQPLSINLSRGYNLGLSRSSNFMITKIVYNSVLVDETLMTINITQRRHVIQLSQQQDVSLDFYFTIYFNNWYIYHLFDSQIEIFRQNLYPSLNDTQCFRIENIYGKTKPIIKQNRCIEASQANKGSKYECSSNKQVRPVLYVYGLLILVIEF